jgi:hypothetical protein
MIARSVRRLLGPGEGDKTRGCAVRTFGRTSQFKKDVKLAGRRGKDVVNQIQLDSDQSRRFVEALLAPSREPAPALKKAKVRHRRRVTET